MSTTFSCFVWNVRGLNDRARRNVVRELLLLHKPSCVCIQETKLSSLCNLLANEILGPVGLQEFGCRCLQLMMERQLWNGGCGLERQFKNRCDVALIRLFSWWAGCCGKKGTPAPLMLLHPRLGCWFSRCRRRPSAGARQGTDAWG